MKKKNGLKKKRKRKDDGRKQAVNERSTYICHEVMALIPLGKKMADLCSRHFVYEQYGYLPSSPATGSCQPVTFVSSHFKFYSDVGFPKYWSKIDNDLFHFENAFYSGNMVLVPVFLFIDLFWSIFDFNSSPFHQQRYKCVGIFSGEESHEYMHFFRKITNKDWTERKR